MPNRFDLEAYLHRIGYAGPTNPDLATLRALHQHHVSAIPFENLDPVTGRPVSLDLDSLLAKLVRSRRGGYCFEQNTLFEAALKSLGFEVTGLAARVRWMTPPERPLGHRGHMLLRVNLADGPYLADVGFGSRLLDLPLKLQVDVEQETAAARYRLTNHDALFGLSSRLASGWQLMYVFGLDAQLPADFEMANWYTSNHPRLWSTTSILVERLVDATRYTLSNTRLLVEYRDGGSTERHLADAAEFADVLDRVFDISLPVPPEPLYARAAAFRPRTLATDVAPTTIVGAP